MSSRTTLLFSFSYPFSVHRSSLLMSLLAPGRASTRSFSVAICWIVACAPERTAYKNCMIRNVASNRKHAPFRTVWRRHQPSTPWFDADCAAAKRKTRALERRYRNTGSLEDQSAWIVQQRSKQRLYSQKQNKYWENRITDSHGNPKKLWNNLASVLRKQKVKPSRSEHISAENFSKAFWTKIEDVHSSTTDAPYPQFTGICCPSSLDAFSSITDDDAVRLISKAANKNSELDPVPTWIVKKYANELSSFIAILFNESLRAGQFPFTQKCAVITPVLKKSTLDQNDLGSYRPISNLTFMSKLLERCAYEQMTSYLTDNGLLPELQSAYTKNRSTETAVLKVLSDAYAAAYDRKVTLLSFLDLSAAFDTVDHGILMQRLRFSFGMGGSVCLTGSDHISRVVLNTFATKEPYLPLRLFSSVFLRVP